MSARTKTPRATTAAQPMPAWIEPMRATLTDRRFSDAGWIYEPKLDGERCLAFVDRGKVKLFSANRQPLNVPYPDLVEALARQKTKQFILDGEVVAFEGDRTSFAKLQQRMHISDPAIARRSPVAVFYYVFDLLFVNGHDIRRARLLERKSLLQDAIDFKPPLVFMTHLDEEGERYYAEACRKGWEGLIAKRSDAPYVTGRSPDWLKFKCVLEQEFVIGGFTDPEGARSGFGALLLGYYEGSNLHYAGKVGTGFDQTLLARMSAQLKAIETPQSPFHTTGIPKRGVHWVKPSLVAQIGFAEWTTDGRLRQGRFMGLRRDKSPKAVVRERPVR